MPVADDPGPIRRLLRACPAWVTFRRLGREGFARAARRVRLWRRVLATPPVRTAPPAADAVELHLLCYQADHLPAVWALKSFYRAARVDFPLVLHVNEPAGRTVFARLRRHFPDAVLIPRAEADRRVNEILAARRLDRLSAARRANPFMLKLTDFPLLAAGRTVFGLDADVLFFAEPRDLLARCANPGRRYLFQRDPADNYNLSPADALRDLGIRLAPRVNTGLMVYPADLPDPAAFDRYLAHPDVARPTGFIEQTLYALHASEMGAVDYLPDAYALDLRPGLGTAGLAARHYAGQSRPLLTAEGMPAVWAAWAGCVPAAAGLDLGHRRPAEARPIPPPHP